VLIRGRTAEVIQFKVLPLLILMLLAEEERPILKKEQTWIC